MKCVHCGKENSEGSKFCEYCGKGLSHSDTLETADQAPRSDDVQQGASAQGADAVEPGKDNEPLLKRKDVRIAAIIVGAILVIGIVVIVLVLTLGAPNPQESGNGGSDAIEAVDDSSKEKSSKSSKKSSSKKSSSSDASSSDASSSSSASSSASSSSGSSSGGSLTLNEKYAKNGDPSFYALMTLDDDDLAALLEGLGYIAGSNGTYMKDSTKGSSKNYIKVKDQSNAELQPQQFLSALPMETSQTPLKVMYTAKWPDLESMLGENREFALIGGLKSTGESGVAEGHALMVLALRDEPSKTFYAEAVPLSDGALQIYLYNQAYLDSGALLDSYDDGRTGITPEEVITTYARKAGSNGWVTIKEQL